MSKYLHTILVVDDEDIIRESFEEIFNKKGYQVIKACNGVHALELLEHSTVDLAIVDLKMPKMNGMTLLKKLKESYTDLPVILMTGYGSEDIAAQALNAGAVNYIKKPFNLLSVIDSIEKTLFYKVYKDRLTKREVLIKKTLRNLKQFELEFPIELETIEGGVMFISEFLFAGSKYKTNIEIGVHEALLNAYYHGSLNALDGIKLNHEPIDLYAIAAEKLKDESVRNKRITLKITSNADEYTFFIKDDGDGFDWREVYNKVEEDFERKPFWRGITLIKTFFDDVAWNEKGNEIIMTLKKKSYNI